MTEYLEGGRRRIDRVLAPNFLENLSEIPLEDLRDKRADADQEEVDLSYARRLLHGRLDVLKAEQDRRAGHGPLAGADHSDEGLAAALSQILTDPGPRSARGMGRHMTAAPTRVGEHRREAERAVADLRLSDPAGLSDDELAEGMNQLREVEAKVSRSRRAVQEVCDSITEEIARRYRAAGSPIDEVADSESPLTK